MGKAENEKAKKPVTKVKKKKQGGIRKYFRDLKSEMKKVTWPSRKQVANNTAVVMVTMCITGLLLAGIDIGLGWLVTLLAGLGA